MSKVKENLKEAEEAKAKVAAEEARNRAVVQELESELRALQDRTVDASISSEELDAELERLRGESAEKAQYLDKAHSQVEALRRSLMQRDEALMRSEHLLKRTVETAPRSRWVPVLVLALVAVSALYAYTIYRNKVAC